MNSSIHSSVILLVEDNPDDVALTRRSMRNAQLPYDLLVARNGEEALKELGLSGETDSDPELPSLILLDLRLPGISGFEVLKQIRGNESTRFIPVVVLTTSREERDILTSYSLGANSYIQKPVDFNRFTEVVKQLGLYWLLLNETPSRR